MFTLNKTSLQKDCKLHHRCPTLQIILLLPSMDTLFLLFLSLTLMVTPSFVNTIPVQSLTNSLKQEQSSFLAPEYVYPDVATDSTPSTYRSEQEISAWGDLLIFFGLLNQHLNFKRKLFTEYSSEEFLILAPTNEAFLSFFKEFDDFFQLDLAVLDTISFIAGLSPYFNGIFSNLVETHIVSGNWSEYDIVEAGKLESISGVLLDTALFPTITIQSTNRSSQRIFRQITSSNGPVRRLCFIDRVLVAPSLQEFFNLENENHPLSTPEFSPEPHSLLGGARFGDIGRFNDKFKVRKTQMSDSNTLNAHFRDECRFSNCSSRWLQVPYLPEMTSTMFMGRQIFRSVQNLLMARTDCIIFSTLVQYLPGVMYKIESQPGPLHALVPTDKALMEFYLSTIDDPGLDLEVPDLKGVIQIVKDHSNMIPSILSSIPGLPILGDVLLFHFCVGAEKPIEKLRGQILKTVAGGFVRVSRDGASVYGADYSRGGAPVISSHATLDGIVTPISGVLTKFDTNLAFLMGMLSWTASQKENNKTNNQYNLHADPHRNSSLATAPYRNEKGEETMQTPEPSERAACFPGDATVSGLVNGKNITMTKLEAGDSILVTPTGQASKVFAFTHRERSGVHPFIEISFQNGMSLTLSDNHYTYTDERLISAAEVQLGQKMISGKGESLTVRAIRRVWKTGKYAPHSMHGDLVVNGVVVSAYTTEIHPLLAHALLTPVRLFSYVTGVQEPLGSMFYNGAGHLSKWVPSGKAAH